jgi:transcriptional regulator with XRE-family HTH domain
MPSRQQYRRTFIRQWREYRGLSLRQLAARLEKEVGGAAISHASLGRIETGNQAYTQPIIEALAEALGADVYDLLNVDPKKAGQVVDLTGYLKRLSESELAQALDYIRFLASKR